MRITPDPTQDAMICVRQSHFDKMATIVGTYTTLTDAIRAARKSARAIGLHAWIGDDLRHHICVYPGGATGWLVTDGTRPAWLDEVWED